MIITAKFASVCPSCSSRIAIGDKVEWSKGSKAAHVACAGGAKVPSGPVSFDGSPAIVAQHWSQRGKGPAVLLCAGGCGRRVRGQYAECFGCARESRDAM